MLKFVQHRVADRRILRLIQKWLKAGVMEEGEWSETEMGTPQGAVISPLLANIYLHYVFDLWVQAWRKKHARGDVVVVRYADDTVLGFQSQTEADRFLEDFRERLGKFGMELHPDKTRRIEFGRYAELNRKRRGEGKPETFDFLGFTHISALPAKETTLHAPTAGLFLAGAALLVIDMLSWAPFVSDYTRYLPVNTSGRRLFWAIYAGNIVSTIIACTIGAYLAALLPALGPVAAIGKISGKWALVILTLSLINSDTLNAYTGAFQVLALGNMWRRFKSVSVMLRVVPFLCVMAVGVAIALLGYKHFVNNLSNFLDVLLVIFIPWSAVNLTDYFLVRRGNYDVTAFFIPDGVYGKVSWRGLLAYAIGLGAEWPFVSQPDYIGPFVSHLGGADISWLVGFFVAAVVYLILVVSSTTETGRHDRQVAATSRW